VYFRPNRSHCCIPDVHLAGFLSQTDLPHAYTSADVLVLPSVRDETWGLAVNEAMNFGLPIIVSSSVGCARDLVRNGWNGFAVEAGNVKDLTCRIRAVVSSKTERERFGQNSQELITQHGLEQSAQQLMIALEAVLKCSFDGSTGLIN
jgi:glycosyltransferase involved in cell wall biosynthesis